MTPVHVRYKLPRKRKIVGGPWPCLHLSDWIRCCFERFAGFFFLAGLTMDSWEEAQDNFRTFWSRYSKLHGDAVSHPESTVPIYIHGDEGRGQCKRPLLVISFQPIMAWGGPNVVNSSKLLSQHGLDCLACQILPVGTSRGIRIRQGCCTLWFLQRTMPPRTRLSLPF